MKALQLRDRASDQERFAIDFSYDRLVTRNLAKAYQTCELWAQTYPRDPQPHAFLTGSTSLNLAKFEKAEQEGKKTIELDPDRAYAYGNLAVNYHIRDRLAEAQGTLERAAERKIQIPEFLVTRYQIAFLKDDKREMERFAALGKERSDVEDWYFGQEAAVLAYSDHLQQARTKSRRAIESARQGGHRERAAQHEAGAALREGFFGNAPESRRSAISALDLSHSRDVEYAVAFALALSGDSGLPETLANDLGKRFSEDTSVRLSFLPALRALLALNHRDHSKAIELLQISGPYELSTIGREYFGMIACLYPAYVRGQAFLLAHRGAEAAGEYQKIVNHRGSVVSDPIGAVAHLQLGRALAFSGDMAKAKTAYQDFLTLWKDADRDIPILIQAKAEYAKLQ